MISSFNTPILFMIFNRPDTTVKVFEEIKKIKPKYLYIGSDGPRESKKGENIIVNKLRKTILERIDWNCEVKTLFRDKNLGCKMAASGAVSWFFENVEKGIILEDDCLPSESFFKYCEELLEKYKNNEKIMHIGGVNFLSYSKEELKDSSYYFSNYIGMWGWASWRRAWRKYDIKMSKFDSIKNTDFLQKKLDSYFGAKYIEDNMQLTKNNLIDTWDYQWVLAIYINNGLTIVPKYNLISNIGFGEEGTHTKDSKNFYANRNIENIPFPLIHPKNIERNAQLDLKLLKLNYWSGLFGFIAYKFIKFLKKIGLWNIIRKTFFK